MTGPKLKKSKATDKEAKAIEDQEFQFTFRDELLYHNDRREQLETNLTKAYGLIWDDYMSPSMVHKIKKHPDFDSKIMGDPI